MAAAFHEACVALGLVDRADPFAERVAKRVIELAGRGIRTRAALCKGTVQMFKADPQETASVGVAPQPAFGKVARPAKPA